MDKKPDKRPAQSDEYTVPGPGEPINLREAAKQPVGSVIGTDPNGNQITLKSPFTCT